MKMYAILKTTEHSTSILGAYIELNIGKMHWVSLGGQNELEWLFRNISTKSQIYFFYEFLLW